jgi:O-antigen ligase/polysaccharide polymerase Wzy-like membrane protein
MMQRLADACDGIVRWGLVALIAFTPLAFGTVEAWSTAIMKWGIATLIVVALGGVVLRGDSGRAREPLKSGLVLPLVLFLALCALQTVPMPRGWLQAASPGSARAYEIPKSLPDGALAAGHFGAMVDQIGLEQEPARRPISLNPESTAARIELLAVFIGLFFLIASWADKRERILFLLGSVTIVGFLVALFGIVQHLTWNGRIYWARRAPRDTAFGPFVNHNHFAGYVEMVIPVALSMAFFLLDARRRVEPGEEPDGAPEQVTPEDFADASESDAPASRWAQSALAFFAAVVLVASLFLSGSRGGILSALLSALILFVLVWRRIPSRLLVWSSAVVLPALTLLFTAWVGADLLKHHGTATQAVEREASLHSRWLVWEAAARHLDLSGWTGFGIGTFEDSFAPYAPPGGAARWDKAHNDYLQLAWETGLVGALLIVWGGIVYGVRYLWPALRARAHPLDLFRLGLAVAVLSLAIHSVVDFNLQIGSNGFLFALLAGLLVATARVVARDEAAADDAGNVPDAAEGSAPRLRTPEQGRIV